MKNNILDRLGLQAYTVRDFLGSKENILNSFKKISEIGYKSVQLAGNYPIAAEEMNEIAIEANLKIVGTHMPWNNLTNNLDKAIEDHKKFNCNLIGTGGMVDEYRKSAEGVLEYIKKINQIADKVYDNGLKFSYHNHSFEFVKFNGKRIMDMLIEGTDPKKVSFVLDTYWVQYGGGDVIEWINKLENRIDLLHLKDMAMGSQAPYYTEILEGNLNFDGIIEAAEKTNVKWYIVEQDTCPGNPFDSIKLSYDNLAKKFN